MRYFQNPYEDYTPEKHSNVETYSKDRILQRIEYHQSKIDWRAFQNSMDGGLYIGPGGVAYMLWYLHKKGLFHNKGNNKNQLKRQKYRCLEFVAIKDPRTDDLLSPGNWR